MMMTDAVPLLNGSAESGLDTIFWNPLSKYTVVTTLECQMKTSSFKIRTPCAATLITIMVIPALIEDVDELDEDVRYTCKERAYSNGLELGQFLTSSMFSVSVDLPWRSGLWTKVPMYSLRGAPTSAR